MPVKKQTQENAAANGAKNTSGVGDTRAADKLAQGLTLVPYRAYNEQGRLAWFCKWVRLERGESISQASKRLSVPPKEPAWTPELKARVDELIGELFGSAKPR